MGYEKFDISKLERLNDIGRFETLVPEVMWEALCEPDELRSIVEIGAGTGLFSAKFAQMAPHATVYAVDVELAMIDWIRNNRPEVEQGRIVPVLATETGIPLGDCFADLVAMINVHHELMSPETVYREAWRVLEPEGRLLAVDWAPKETPKGPGMAVRIGPAEAIRFLEDAGFVDAESHQGLPWHWLVTARKPA